MSPTSDEYCTAHERWLKLGVKHPDPTYERKLVEGLIESSWDTLTDTQANALLNGRYRGDCRTLDDYVTDEPIGIEIGRFDG